MFPLPCLHLYFQGEILACLFNKHLYRSLFRPELCITVRPTYLLSGSSKTDVILLQKYLKEKSTHLGLVFLHSYVRKVKTSHNLSYLQIYVNLFSNLTPLHSLPIRFSRISYQDRMKNCSTSVSQLWKRHAELLNRKYCQSVQTF